MKSMTRILSLALAVILALSLCAVGAFADDAPPSGEPEGETTRSATPAPETETPIPAETATPTTLQDTYTTDSSGHFTTNYYPCGSGWTRQEISAPTGYTVDPNSYPIGAEPGTVELAANDTAITVKEQIIKGKLAIVKQDALTETPLAGAVFTVMDETEATVTEATTGEDGTATVEELPYGAYTAKETKAPDGYQLDETVFDFAITEDGQTITLTREADRRGH